MITANDSVETVQAYALYLAEQLDLNKLELGRTVCALAVKYGGDLQRALQDLAAQLSGRITRRTLARYTIIAATFPNAESILEQYPHCGLGTLECASKLPEHQRTQFIQLVSDEQLPLTKQQELVRKMLAQTNHSEAISQLLNSSAMCFVAKAVIAPEGLMLRVPSSLDLSELDGLELIVRLQRKEGAR